MLTTKVILERKINSKRKIRINNQTKKYHSPKRNIPTSNGIVVVRWDIYPQNVLIKLKKKWICSSDNRTVGSSKNSNSIHNYTSKWCIDRITLLPDWRLEILSTRKERRHKTMDPTGYQIYSRYIHRNQRPN